MGKDTGIINYIVDRNLGNFTEFVYDYNINGGELHDPNSNPIYRGLLYVDGIGSDYILTKLLTMESPLIILRGNLDSRLWYEKLFIPYNLDDSPENNSLDANVIIINSIEDIVNAWKALKNSIIYNRIKGNIIKLKNTIFSISNINNYLEVLLNKLSSKLSLNSITPITKNLIEFTTTRNILVREDFIGIIIGQKGNNLNKIKLLTDTEITIAEKSDVEEGEIFPEQMITIKGGDSGVSIAYNIIEKYAKSKIEYYALKRSQLYGEGSLASGNVLFKKLQI